MPSPKKSSVRIAIIGTGGMAANHAKRFKEVPGCTLVAAVDVSRERVEKFAADHGIPATFLSLDELLKGAEFDAVSIVTPDPFHAAQSIQCLKAGKHVLCEKPLALNHSDASKMVAAAQKAGVINMVNLSYRDWPAIQAVAKVIAAGRIGEIRHVEANYLQSWLPSKIWGDWRTTPAWLWRLSTKHGSRGVLGDVGVHIVDFATFPAGPVKNVYCKLKTFDKAPGNIVGEYTLDANDSAVMTVEFANGALGTIHTTRWSGGHANRLFLKISGTKGSIEIDSERSTTSYKFCAGHDLDKAQWITIDTKPTPNNYARFIKSIRTGKQDQPDFARGAEVQKVLDACITSDAKGRPINV
ncbi:Gfo/Idh/MocA family protein [Rariglobus hedericola]|uniref:Gfo/Idh/MocA family oxidoreductase n=1 Tax=Rariglobus hedericola TaxID=2597822 RepID=A0A556QRD0_9BACT|nr:Gfo/Idh/MocA family oxidoreductase [Rariglobus hedericola]TSJ79179.1 Gfo/Idh/MocA family oxidoreductase [Rariglobus hedericola]